MAALIYDPTSQAFKEAGGAKVYSSGNGAYVDAGGKVWNGSEWVDALGGSAVLTVGGIYTLAGTKTTANTPIKAVCIQIDKTNKTAVMQSYGFGHGSWPGEGTLNASSYGTDIGDFDITNIQLAKGSSASNLTACGVSGQSSLIHTAHVDAASNYSSFGVGSGSSVSWLGTPSSSTQSWGVYSNGNCTKYYYRDVYVVAPCFILSTRGVKLDGTTLYA